MSKGIVIAEQPDAVEVGARILMAGGNAVDDAMACAQGVVDQMNGVAGYGCAQIYLPGRGLHEGAYFLFQAPASVVPGMWNHRLEHTQQFERYVRDEQFIVECYLVSGGFDYVLKVVARDVDHYREIMDDMLAAEIGIERFSSFIALQQIKQSRGIPLGLIGVSSAERDQRARIIRRG